MKYIALQNKNVIGVYDSRSTAYANADADDYKEMSVSELENYQRAWRDKELKSTDWIVPVIDHPERASYLTYRTNLRDWPSTDDFPNTKPTL